MVSTGPSSEGATGRTWRLATWVSIETGVKIRPRSWRERPRRRGSENTSVERKFPRRVPETRFRQVGPTPLVRHPGGVSGRRLQTHVRSSRERARPHTGIRGPCQTDCNLSNGRWWSISERAENQTQGGHAQRPDGPGHALVLAQCC